MTTATDHRNRKYPWEKWFSCPQFTLYQGRDYENPISIERQIRNKAKEYGVGVHIVSSPRADRLTVTVREK